MSTANSTLAKVEASTSCFESNSKISGENVPESRRQFEIFYHCLHIPSLWHDCIVIIRVKNKLTS